MISFLNFHVFKIGKTEVLEGYVGPCLDTPNCIIPACCGIITGRKSIFSLVYNNTVSYKRARFDGRIQDVDIGSKKNELEINFPTLPVPALLAQYDYNLCNSSPCPQNSGEVYKLWLPFRFPTSVLTTLVRAENCDRMLYQLNKIILLFRV